MKIEILPLAFLPNKTGFEFTGIGYHGEVYPNSKVLINNLRQHYVNGYKNLIGWIKNDGNKITK